MGTVSTVGTVSADLRMGHSGRHIGFWRGLGVRTGQGSNQRFEPRVRTTSRYSLEPTLSWVPEHAHTHHAPTQASMTSLHSRWQLLKEKDDDEREQVVLVQASPSKWERVQLRTGVSGIVSNGACPSAHARSLHSPGCALSHGARFRLRCRIATTAHRGRVALRCNARCCIFTRRVAWCALHCSCSSGTAAAALNDRTRRCLACGSNAPRRRSGRWMLHRGTLHIGFVIFVASRADRNARRRG